MRRLAKMTTRGENLTRAFDPGLAPYVRWLRTPLAALILAGTAAALCGLFLHAQGFVVFFGILVVMTLGLIWPWLSVRGLDGSLSFDRSRCREGESVTVRLTIRNRMPWAALGIFVQGGFQDRSGVENSGVPLVGLAIVPGWQTVTETVEFVPVCRGEYPDGPPRAVCGFPFGLWEAARPLDVASKLLVWPRTYPVAAVPEARGHEAGIGLAMRDRAGQWGDPLGVRPYRRGDPFRRIHWALTARHGELIVREVQSNAVPRVLIALDADPAAHTGLGPDGSREWAIRVAASLAEGWIGQGADVQLVSDGVSVTPPGGSAQTRLTSMLDALARLGPGGGKNLAALLSLPEWRRRDIGLRVVVTTEAGLGSLAKAGWRHSDVRIVMLKPGAFGAGRDDESSSSFPCVPWIVIDDVRGVATSLRRFAKEVALG
jgi:uncharacterized protein (DUF58 family)